MQGGQLFTLGCVAGRRRGKRWITSLIDGDGLRLGPAQSAGFFSGNWQTTCPCLHTDVWQFAFTGHFVV